MSLTQHSFGLIATDKGFNIFVAGNGGAKPKHSELLAKDVLPSEVVPILDRYLMFYIRTADKLQRTARWLENLPGGITYLREVILEDRLGICASLEAQMCELVDSFFDEWAEAVRDPAMAARFRQFHNTDETLDTVETELDRDQERPVFWPADDAKAEPDAANEVDFKGLRDRWSSTAWQPVIAASHFDGADDAPSGISATIKRGDTQLAVWRIRGRYYATQQMCPHKRAFALSDGLIGEKPCDGADKAEAGCDSNGHGNGTGNGDSNGNGSASTPSPWISCPFHKRNFDLTDGDCKSDPSLSIATFPVEARADGMVYLKLPPVAELDAALGTKRWMVRKGESGESPFAELDKKIKFVGRRGKKPTARPHANGAVKMTRPLELMAGGQGGCGSAPDW